MVSAHLGLTWSTCSIDAHPFRVKLSLYLARPALSSHPPSDDTSILRRCEQDGGSPGRHGVVSEAPVPSSPESVCWVVSGELATGSEIVLASETPLVCPARSWLVEPVRPAGGGGWRVRLNKKKVRESRWTTEYGKEAERSWQAAWRRSGHTAGHYTQHLSSFTVSGKSFHNASRLSYSPKWQELRKQKVAFKHWQSITIKELTHSRLSFWAAQDHAAFCPGLWLSDQTWASGFDLSSSNQASTCAGLEGSPSELASGNRFPPRSSPGNKHFLISDRLAKTQSPAKIPSCCIGNLLDIDTLRW